MIDNPELLLFLQTEQARAVDTQLNDERATALSFYRGDLFGDEVDGRSKLRTRDVAEVVDYMTISVMRTMASGDRLVEFEPTAPGQEEVAQQATDRVHWNFLREQDGYQILHDGIKAGLLEKSGVWKTWVEIPQEPVSVRLNALDLEALEAEPVEVTEVPDLIDMDEAGNPLAVYDVTVMQPGQPVFRDAAIPNDEFFIAPDARTIESAAYVGNTSRVSLYDLTQMGYAWEDLETVYGTTDSEAQVLTDARDEGRSNREEDTVRRDWNRVVTLREEYTRWFYEGRYQLVMVHRVGNTILGVQPARMIPYVLWCPFPMPHRLIGHSLADKVLDIQVVRSHMLRQAMDNLYQANANRWLLDESAQGANTIDDMLDVAPGGIIRYKNIAPTPVVVPAVAGNAFSAMEVMAGEKERRTGVTPLNQGLDADALNRTASGTAMIQAGGQQVEESVARQAGNAIGELFEKKLRLMIEFMPAHAFRMDGEFVELSPQDWPQDMRLGVRVGLGTGNRDKRLQGVMALQEAMAAADAAGLVDREHVFNAAKLLVANLGLGTATQFFKDPATMPPQEEQEDPEVLAAQAKLQAQQQEAAAKLQMQRDEAAARIELERDRQAFEQELQRRRAEAEFELARDKMNAEIQLAQMRAQAEQQLSRNRPGGDLAV